MFESVGVVLPVLLFINAIVLLVGQNLFESIFYSIIILLLVIIITGLRILIRYNYFKSILNTIDIRNIKGSGEYTLYDCDIDDLIILKSLTCGDQRINNIQLLANKQIIIQYKYNKWIFPDFM